MYQVYHIIYFPKFCRIIKIWEHPPLVYIARLGSTPPCRTAGFSTLGRPFQCALELVLLKPPEQFCTGWSRNTQCREVSGKWTSKLLLCGTLGGLNQEKSNPYLKYFKIILFCGEGKYYTIFALLPKIKGNGHKPRVVSKFGDYAEISCSTSGICNSMQPVIVRQSPVVCSYHAAVPPHATFLRGHIEAEHAWLVSSLWFLSWEAKED